MNKKIIPKNINTEEEIPVNEVWDVLEFARQSLSGIYGMGAVMTPDLINRALADKGFYPVVGSETEILDALNDPKQNEKRLRQFSQNLEMVSAPFKRIMQYQNSFLSYDWTYTCTNAEKKDYNTPAYKKDEKKFLDFMDRFDYKQQFGNAVHQMLRNEMYAFTPRFDGEKIVFQELPLDRIKITALWDRGFLGAFDFSYFLVPGISLKLFPKFYSEVFNDLFGGGQQYRVYDPARPLDQRGDSQFSVWADCPPESLWIMKFDTSIVTSVSPYSSLLLDFSSQNLIRSLQKNMYIAQARKILMTEIPLLKDSKAKVSDMISINPETLGKFLSVVKAALGDAIQIGSVPLENLQMVDFQANDESYSNYLHTAVSASGVNTPLIFSGKLKANAVESMLSHESDALIMNALYPQFNSFINYFANKDTGKFKFELEFEGNNYYLNRQQRFDYAVQMANLGMVLPQKFAAARGMKPSTFMRQLEHSKAIGFTDMLTPITPANQMSKEQSLTSGEKGRPQKKSGDLSDGGLDSRGSASNIEKGGSV